MSDRSVAGSPVGSSVPGDTETAVPDEAARALLVAWYGHPPVEGADFLPASYDLARFALAAARPLLVSAEAERLRIEVRDLGFALDSMRRERDTAEAITANWKARTAEARAVVEGLRAELAKVRAELDLAYAEGANIGAEIGAHAAREVARNAQTVMDLLAQHGAGIVGHLLDTDDNAGQRLRSALARLAVLRAAGGQEKPDALCLCGHPVHGNPCGAPIGEHQCACRQKPPAAAPVGGQAEPSDALMTVEVYTCSECDRSAAAEHWHTLSAQRLRKLRLQIERGEVDADSVWIDDELMVCPRCQFEHHDNESSMVDVQTGRVVLAAAAVSGEQR